jgi:hypothetical protein
MAEVRTALDNNGPLPFPPLPARLRQLRLRMPVRGSLQSSARCRRHLNCRPGTMSRLLPYRLLSGRRDLMSAGRFPVV